jgi:hypothetical protein
MDFASLTITILLALVVTLQVAIVCTRRRLERLRREGMELDIQILARCQEMNDRLGRRLGEAKEMLKEISE